MAKAGVEAGEIIQEFRVPADVAAEYKAGAQVPVGVFAVGQMVDVQGTSIGKGFTGTIKRHNFKSQRASHGNSRSHNVPGSISMAQDPGRVFPGKKMSGQLGNVTKTTQNLDIVRIDEARQLLLVRGAVPGAKNGHVVVRPAVKAPPRRPPRKERTDATRTPERARPGDRRRSTRPTPSSRRDYNEALVHQIVVAFQANARQGTRAQLDRGEVKHSTKKPWRQKGTGRARAGMTSSPLWRGGGRIFPNSPDENFTQKVNKKMYRAGMAAILSQLAREGRLAVVDSLTVDSPKTKPLAQKFKAMGLDSVLVITDQMADNLMLASRNLANVLVVEPRYADPLPLVHYKKVLVTKGAMEQLKEMLA